MDDVFNRYKSTDLVDWTIPANNRDYSP